MFDAVAAAAVLPQTATQNAMFTLGTSAAATAATPAGTTLTLSEIRDATGTVTFTTIDPALSCPGITVGVSMTLTAGTRFTQNCTLLNSIPPGATPVGLHAAFSIVCNSGWQATITVALPTGDTDINPANNTAQTGVAVACPI